MSVETKAFLKQGLNIFHLKKYLDKKYQDVSVKGIKIGEKFSSSFSFFFKDGEDNRIMFLNIAIEDGESDYYPAPAKRGESCTLSLGCWGNSVEIISDILQHFGGGFILSSDYGYGFDDGPDWEFISPIEGVGNELSEREQKLYTLIKKEKGSLNYDEIALFDFVMRNLDKIKAI